MLGTLYGYQIIARNPEQSLKAIANDKIVKRETTYYENNIGKIKTADELVKDRRIFNFVMRAFGMNELTNAKALVRKVMEGGIDNSDALARKLADPRFRDLAETFNFPRYGATTTTFTRTQKGVVDRYVRAALEENAGKTNEGVRLALYFERKARDVKSIYQLLGDKALYRVVETALSLPSSLPTMGVEKQAAYIAKKLDIADLQDSNELKKFLERFANLWDLQSSATTANPTLTLLQPQSSFGISAETLASINNLTGRRT